MLVATYAALVIFYLLLVTTIIRLSTRLVTGLKPTYVSALVAYLFKWFFSTGLVFGVRLTSPKPAPGSLLLLLLAIFVIQVGLYTLCLKDENGIGVTGGQAFLVSLVQVPVGFVLAFTVVAVLFATGLTLGTLAPQVREYLPASVAARLATPLPAATPAPAPAPRRPRAAWLAQPLALPTRYGTVSLPSGTAVQILDEVPGGFRVRVSGSEVVLRKDQVTPGL